MTALMVGQTRMITPTKLPEDQGSHWLTRASEIFGKHRQKKKSWVTAEILDPRDKRTELRKKRFELEGSEKY